ncbi:MAG: DNA repair protein RecO [Alphaproteobacteria bacterium]|nr:DNA repair protein RecO [Alphaproteobacteria bacterium]
MEWLDEGIVLGARAHGEHATIVMLLTADHGRHAGLMPGGQKAKGLLQPGNHVRARWRARLPEHLGNYSLDLLATCGAQWFDDAFALAAISSACAMTDAALPERQPLPHVYGALLALLALEDSALWGAAYVKWELGLLAALGYGLDLTRCAVEGTAVNLAYVSPRTGRAVSQGAGAAYRERLLMLPPFLLGEAGWEPQEVLQGLALTGHFLLRHVFAQKGQADHAPRAGALPAARQRLADVLERRAGDNRATA